MSRGSLKCCGSPLFLTSQYASGYDLILTLEQNTPQKIGEISKIVKKIVKESQFKSSVNSELFFKLSAKFSKDFPILLDELENLKEKLSITNVSISANTIEQVFLK